MPEEEDDDDGNRAVIQSPDGKAPNPLFGLRGFNATVMVHGDAMHTIGGVIFGFWKMIQGLRELNGVTYYERSVNKRSFGNKYRSSKIDMLGGVILNLAQHLSCAIHNTGVVDDQKMQHALNQIAKHETANQAGARFRRLMDASIKPRTHHAFVLAGTIHHTG